MTFYSTAAQVIPFLLVAGVIESRLASRRELLRDVGATARAVAEATPLPLPVPEYVVMVRMLVFIITRPLLWVLILLAGESAAFFALWFGDNVILAVITGVSLGYGLVLVLAGAAIQLAPEEPERGEEEEA